MTAESKEAIALALLEKIAVAEGKTGIKATRQFVLDTYAECLAVVTAAESQDKG